MELFPAIDLRGAKVVRLTEGDYDRMTVYGDNPFATAESFVKLGAKNIHMVDLDGALEGVPVNAGVISEVASKLGMFLEVGGGIRDEKRIEQYIEAGAGRVILGTVAVEQPDFVLRAVKRFGDKIAVGVDAKDGKVAIHGWKTVTDINSFEFCEYLRDSGVDCVIYTDISRDGMLAGTNLQAYERLSGLKGLKIVASGGITRADELKALKEMGIYGAILGKAMYSGALPLEVALAAVGEGKC